MFTYQIRRRVLRLSRDAKPEFPCHCIAAFHFGPTQPFGEAAGGGRTTVQSKPATATFNANSGRHTIVSKEPLSPLEVKIQEPDRTVEMHGSTLQIAQQVSSVANLLELLESIYFAFPILLNLGYGDPPYVERVDGSVGGIPFRWELAEWKMEFEITTQDRQEEIVAAAWTRIGLLSGLHSRRLISALHYFHVAVRLERCGETAGEFMAEAVLNLAKLLEVLFPGRGDGKTREAIRDGLGTLGYSAEEIDRDFMPAVALRNHVDVGHVLLSLLTLQQVTTIHAYAERAERSFREMLKRLLDRIDAGEFKMPPDGDLLRSKETEETLARLQANLGVNRGPGSQEGQANKRLE